MINQWIYLIHIFTTDTKMKYVITENRMTGIVKRYLDREFDASELHFNQPEFEDHETFTPLT